ncbi:MAG: DUF4317 domain-containing protein [Lachnospiraceae bacterium]|nr:DUF4317 domain-containing protein [Lachnospiraceae bacterium]
MNKKDVTEIKRRLKKESCTISRISGCYVDSGKNKVLTFSKSFLNLEDEEFYKYLDIANKVLSGKLLNNLLVLDFPADAEGPGGAQASLLALRSSELKDDNLLNVFYDKVIETYDTVENYLILLFHDTYDIPMKTTDEFSLGESEEVYEYIICALCPVALAKPGLSYHEDENTIAALQRSWIVGAPDTGFTFPAFSERSADIHSVLAYCKNAKEPHKEFFENCLACPAKLTSTEKKKAFNDMMTNALGPNNDDAVDILTDVQQSLCVYIEDEIKENGNDEPVIIPAKDIAPILTDNGFSEEKAAKIQKEYEEYFGSELPEAEELLDNKLLKDNEKRVENKVLRETIVDMGKQLKEAGLVNEDGHPADIVVKIDENRVDEVTAAFVDGKRCIVIPLEDDDELLLNGEKTVL